MPEPRRLPVPILLAAALLCAALAPPAGAASPGFDLRGTWQGAAAGGGATGSITITSENCDTGALAGTGSGSGDTWKVSGTLDGAAVTLTFSGYAKDKTYRSTGSGTVSDGNRISGTFRDTDAYKDKDGDFQLTRTSGPPQDGAGCVSRRNAAVRVQCTYAVATSIDTCTVTVADARGAPDPPTGTVRFSRTGGGSFIAGDTCELRRSAGAPSTATCSVQYQAPFGSTSFPQVTAAYSGSPLHAPATAKTTFMVLTGPLPWATPEPGAITVDAQVALDGTTLQACALLPSAAAGPAQIAPTLSGLPTALQAIADALRVGTPQQMADAFKRHEGLLTEVAGQLRVLDDRISALKGSSNAADVAELQRLLDLQVRMDSALSELIKAQQENCRKIATSLRSSVGAAAASRRAVVIGATRRATVRKGRRTLKLTFSRAAVRRAAGRRATVTAYLAVHEVLPSALHKGGWPRSTIRRIVLTRDGRRR